MRLFKLSSILFLTTLLLTSYGVFGQNITINGMVLDSSLKKPLNSATISLANAKDSSLLSFTRSEDDGYFEVKNVKAGKYLLSISYIG